MTKQELELEIRDLYEENRMLKDMIQKLEEQQKYMEVSLSLEETIQAFRDMGEAESRKPKYDFNPFGGLFGNTDSDGGKSDAMMNPDAFPEDGDASLDDEGEDRADSDDGR